MSELTDDFTRIAGMQREFVASKQQADGNEVVMTELRMLPHTEAKKHANRNPNAQHDLTSKQIVLLNAAYMAFYHLLQHEDGCSIVVKSDRYIVPDKARETQVFLANWLTDRLVDELDNQNGRLWGESEIRNELFRVLLHDLRKPSGGKFRYMRVSIFPSGFRLTVSPLQKSTPGKRGRAEQAECAKKARWLKKVMAA